MKKPSKKKTPKHSKKKSQQQTSQDTQYRLFVDPASISTGWALFRGPEFIKSGTVAVDKKLPVFLRLSAIYQNYISVRSLMGVDIVEVHIEQLVRNTHIYTHWGVGVIGTVFGSSSASVLADIPISSWQKYCDWKETKEPLKAYKEAVKSEDELAAIGMGLWFTQSRLK